MRQPPSPEDAKALRSELAAVLTRAAVAERKWKAFSDAVEDGRWLFGSPDYRKSNPPASEAVLDGWDRKTDQLQGHGCEADRFYLAGRRSLARFVIDLTRPFPSLRDEDLPINAARAIRSGGKLYVLIRDESQTDLPLSFVVVEPCDLIDLDAAPADRKAKTGAKKGGRS